VYFDELKKSLENMDVKWKSRWKKAHMVGKKQSKN
jgi:hypothetical protein